MEIKLSILGILRVIPSVSKVNVSEIDTATIVSSCLHEHANMSLQTVGL